MEAALKRLKTTFFMLHLFEVSILVLMEAALKPQEKIKIFDTIYISLYFRKCFFDYFF